MSDRIVCVCGCHVVTGWCMWHSDGTHPWEKADVGRLCHRCKMPVQAINIDQLIRERDAARKNVMDMEDATACVPEDFSVDEYVTRLQAENERLREIAEEGVEYASELVAAWSWKDDGCQPVRLNNDMRQLRAFISTARAVLASKEQES